MKLRTETEIPESGLIIGYDTPVMFIGSCFAGEIGRMFSEGKMDVMVNPFGVMYNPLSTARALEIIMDGKPFEEDDLYFFEDRYLSFQHDTAFSSRNISTSLSRINNSILNAKKFLRKASVIFITFGTAWAFRLKEDNEIVANCHKIPAARFSRQLLDVSEIVDRWKSISVKIKEFNPGINLVFTVSPVRHLKDGSHGNQVSKSSLILAINKLLSENNELTYFPSYEIILDDLRDYRYYKKDMVHPSETAIEYIWEIFSKVYFRQETIDLYKRVVKITGACRHRLTDSDSQSMHRFGMTMLEKIRDIRNDFPIIDLYEEEDYFNKLVSG